MKKRNKSIQILMIFIVLSSSSFALIIQGIESSKDAYSNGELVELTIYANEKNLIFNADFSKVDSNYNQDSIIYSEVSDFQYKIWYPITFSNEQGSGLHNVLISAYSKSTETSSIASYGLELDNTVKLNQSVASSNIILQVRDSSHNYEHSQNTSLSVQDGTIMICKPSGCETLTEEEYEKGRRIIIDSGEVELSGLTYNQLKSEIETDVSKAIKKDIQVYVDQIIGINKKLETNLFDLKNMMGEAESNFNNETIKAKKIIQQGFIINLLTVFIVLLIILGFFYLIYLKTHSTWLN